MLVHKDWDNHHEDYIRDVKLPTLVESISFSYDGGRLYISVNGEEIYKAFSGTLDCTVTIDRK